jgi:uncharacterized protein (DUF1501 family)
MNWQTCEHVASPEGCLPTDRSFQGRVYRRDMLATTLAAAVALWAGKSALGQVAISKARKDRDILVTIFLRGGMDGLSAIVPYADDAYHRARPSLSLGRPKPGGVLDLDGFFGLHPSLAPLLPLYREGKLGAIHGVGSLDQSRSHFEAMGIMERGAASDPAQIASGWLGRALAAMDDGQNTSPLRAIAFAPVMPDILRGATTASVLTDLAQLKLDLPASASPGLHASLAKLYATGDDPISRAGRETLSVLETLKKLDPKSYKPSSGAAYPDTALGNGLRQTALLIKADVGLEAAALDREGWDTHIAQGTSGGYLALQLDDVAKSLAAFATDLGPELSRVSCVVMTEFGRRVAENSGLGTDHGRASCWLTLGGAGGGKVYARWKELKPENLEDPGDVPVTIDYRDILSDLLTRRLKLDGRALFPGAPGLPLP